MLICKVICVTNVTVSDAPVRIDAEKMSVGELRAAIAEGLSDLELGRTQDAESAFAAFREAHK